MQNEPIEIHTARLVIREHTVQDLSVLHAFWSHAEGMRYLPELKTNNLAASQAQLQTILDERQKLFRARYDFAIVQTKDGTYIGEIGFEISDRTPEGAIAWLWYGLLREYQKNGYAKEAVSAVMRFAFQDAGIFKVCAGCLAENTASENILIRAGMQKESYLSAHTLHEGQRKDRIEYGLYHSEWQQRSF